MASLGVEQDGDALGNDHIGGPVGEQEAARADSGGVGDEVARIADARIGRQAGDAGDEGVLRARGDCDGSAKIPPDEGDALDALAPERVERVEDAGAAIGEGVRSAIAQLDDGGGALERGGKLGEEVSGASERAVASRQEQDGGMVATGGTPDAMHGTKGRGDGERGGGSGWAFVGVELVERLRRAHGLGRSEHGAILFLRGARVWRMGAVGLTPRLIVHHGGLAAPVVPLCGMENRIDR